MRRRVHETIALDQSLRRSRMIWASLAAIFLVPALFGLVASISGLFALPSMLLAGYITGDVLWNIIWGGIVFFADLICFLRIAEANRRLKLLKEDPAASVRPLPAPFLASLFGPYH